VSNRKRQESLAEGNLKMKLISFLLASALTIVAASSALAAGASPQQPLTAETLAVIGSRFHRLMDLANRHDVKGIGEMFWQSPSALLVAKSAVPSEGNWAGFWGNGAIEQKLHDIAASGPVVLDPDFSKLKVVGLTPEIAETYAPTTITVSYAGQDGTPKPFLMIVTWKKVGEDWKIATEIILPVPPVAAGKG
jgi:hypothetical protein